MVAKSAQTKEMAPLGWKVIERWDLAFYMFFETFWFLIVAFFNLYEYLLKSSTGLAGAGPVGLSPVTLVSLGMKITPSDKSRNNTVQLEAQKFKT